MDEQYDDEYEDAEPEIPSKEPTDPEALQDEVVRRKYELPPNEDLQFSLVEMLAIFPVVALMLAIAGILPGGYTPANMAGFLGFCLLGGLVLLLFIPEPRPILRFGLWIIFSVYLVVAIAAAVTKSGR